MNARTARLAPHALYALGIAMQFLCALLPGGMSWFNWLGAGFVLGLWAATVTFSRLKQ